MVVQLQLLGAVGVAIGTLIEPVNVAILLVGTTIGVVMGMIPGMNGAILLSLLIPITYGIDPLVAFMLLVVANGGTSQGGAITAILLNIPGKAPNAATLLDGYPMTRQGRGAEAIGASATASALGALLGIAFLALSIPIMVQIVQLFGPPEIFWLGIWGVAVVSIVVGDRLRAGLISGGFGFIFAMHGISQVTGGSRWTFGQAALVGGIGLIPAILGLFAIAEMINLVSQNRQIASSNNRDIGSGKWEGVYEVFKHKWLFARSSLLGVIIGVIPGVGGTAANYISYFQAAQTASDSESFGSGDVRGVIASEAANDAKEGGAYVPTLGFGIPGSTSMAILLGAFLLHGIRPGPLLLENHLDVVSIIILSALVSNFVSSAIVLGFAKQLTSITRIDIRIMAPIIISVAFLGSFAISNNINNLWVTLIFGILGFFMIKVDMSRVPMILGMVLAPIVEENFFRSLQLSRDSYWIFVRSPLTWLLILLVVITLFIPYIQSILKEHQGDVL